MNITDVGHLTGDDDTGVDKLEKGAKKTGKTVWDLAKFYTEFFFKTTDALNILRPDIIAKATDHIPEMVQLIKKLQEKDFIYETKEAVYFNTAKFKDYGKLSGQKLTDKKIKARADVYLDPEKKNATDFALWFKRVGRFAAHTMHWNSPWGDGFPGWHIECSAMSMKYLGETIDIHAGGVDHIAVHHENEIAQSEGATGKPFVRFWFHNNFLTIAGQKMSKSLGNFFTIEDLNKHRIEPLALRYLFLQSHYRQVLNFTWDSAKAAEEGYNKLKAYVRTLQKQTQRTTLSAEKLKKLEDLRQRFIAAISNDLQTTDAVAITWELVKSSIPSGDKLDLLFEFDQVLGLKLNEVREEKIPEEIAILKKQRDEARKQKNFKKSDEIRKEIETKGFVLDDTETETVIKKA